MNHQGQSSLPSLQNCSNEKESKPAKSNAAWPDELVERLKALFAADRLSCSGIATELGHGLTRNAVIGKLARLGLRRHRERHSGIRIINPQDRRPRQNRPRLRIVANGGGGSRIMESVERGPLKLRAVEIVPLNLDLDALNSQTCRYPYGDGPFHFCGHPVRAGSSWCAPHHALCTVRQ